MSRKTAMDALRDMLWHWGEWEVEDRYSARYQRSILGRLGESPGTGDGRPLPPGVWIPSDVLMVGRLMQQMKLECRAGRRYARLIWRQYVIRQPLVDGETAAMARAERWLLEAWKSQRQSPEKKREE
jgi:hypothetical protein